MAQRASQVNLDGQLETVVKNDAMMEDGGTSG